jgi:hypothetical protein
MTRNALARLTASTASGLSATGPAQADFLAQIARAHATGGAVNALANGGSSAANLLTRGLGPRVVNVPSWAPGGSANALAAP